MSGSPSVTDLLCKKTLGLFSYTVKILGIHGPKSAEFEGKSIDNRARALLSMVNLTNSQICIIIGRSCMPKNKRGQLSAT